MLVGRSVDVIRMSGDRRPIKEHYDEAIEKAVQSEADGFDFVFSGEHHFEADQWTPSPLTLQTAIAANTSTIRLGTAIIQAPYYHPIRLAEQLATIDIISGGRMSVAAGTGSAEHEFRTFNIPPKERHGRTFETMAIVKGMFENEVYDHQGRYFTFPDIALTTRPMQKSMPLFVAAMGPKNMRRAGKGGFDLMFSPTAAWYVDEYIEGLKEGGHSIDDVNIAGYMGFGLVVATQQEADQIRDTVYDMAAEFTIKYQQRRAVQRDTVSVESELNKRKEHPGKASVGPVGTPDQVLRALEKLYKDFPITHLMGDGTFGPMGSSELWLKEVAPVLREWGRDPVGTELVEEVIPEAELDSLTA